MVPPDIVGRDAADIGLQDLADLVFDRHAREQAGDPRFDSGLPGNRPPCRGQAAGCTVGSTGVAAPTMTGPGQPEQAGKQRTPDQRGNHDFSPSSIFQRASRDR